MKIGDEVFFVDTIVHTDGETYSNTEWKVFGPKQIVEIFKYKWIFKNSYTRLYDFGDGPEIPEDQVFKTKEEALKKLYGDDYKLLKRRKK